MIPFAWDGPVRACFPGLINNAPTKSLRRPVCQALGSLRNSGTQLSCCGLRVPLEDALARMTLLSARERGLCPFLPRPTRGPHPQPASSSSLCWAGRRQGDHRSRPASLLMPRSRPAAATQGGSRNALWAGRWGSVTGSERRPPRRDLPSAEQRRPFRPAAGSGFPAGGLRLRPTGSPSPPACPSRAKPEEP